MTIYVINANTSVDITVTGPVSSLYSSAPNYLGITSTSPNIVTLRASSVEGFYIVSWVDGNGAETAQVRIVATGTNITNNGLIVINDQVDLSTDSNTLALWNSLKN